MTVSFDTTRAIRAERRLAVVREVLRLTLTTPTTEEGWRIVVQDLIDGIDEATARDDIDLVLSETTAH
jgi:hypothetical protein